MAEPKAAVQDLRKHDFQAWRHHPVSKVVQRFLADRADALWADLKERFKVGTLRLVDETEFRGRLNEIDDYLTFEWGAIEAFYGIEPKAETENSEVGIEI